MTPAERAAYQRGMEVARSIMVVETAPISDAHGLAVLSLAFRAVNEEIAKVAGVVPAGHRVDYLALVQAKARQVLDASGVSGGEVATVQTPIGVLSCWTYPVLGWKYRSEYKLNGQRVTVRQIVALGLAQRPTSRERKRKNG
jgi:hypothetical protein